MREPTEFEIDGLTFEFRQMPLEQACKALELVSSLAQGALVEGDMKAKIAGALAGAVGKLPALIDAFVPFCKVEGEGLAAGRRVELKAFKGDAFDGRLDRALLFVSNCAACEFGDFLGEGLERLASGLGALAARYPSLMARIPSSGD